MASGGKGKAFSGAAFGFEKIQKEIERARDMMESRDCFYRIDIV